MQQIVETVRRFDGALVVIPDAGGTMPELSWGDAFFYYAPDGVMPERTQPYGTMIIKNYPGDEASNLEESGRFRVNIHVGRDRAATLAATEVTPADIDAFFPHPLYGEAGWVSVVNPASRTAEAVVTLLREAHRAAQDRAQRRVG
jgi:hypothetical protein